jgi:TPR repeat protein
VVPQVGRAGDVFAQEKLGTLYAKIQGDLQDPIEALKWLSLAAGNGQANAAEERDALATSMSPDDIEEAQNRAREWKPTKENHQN